MSNTSSPLGILHAFETFTHRTATPQQKFSDDMGGSGVQLWDAGEKHSAVLRDALPSKPPTTYSNPPSAAIAHALRLDAMG